MSTGALRFAAFSLFEGEEQVLTELSLEIGRGLPTCVTGPHSPQVTVLVDLVCGGAVGGRSRRRGSAFVGGHRLSPTHCFSRVEREPLVLLGTIGEALADSRRGRALLNAVAPKLGWHVDRPVLELSSWEQWTVLLVAAAARRPWGVAFEAPSVGAPDQPPLAGAIRAVARLVPTLVTTADRAFAEAVGGHAYAMIGTRLVAMHEAPQSSRGPSFLGDTSAPPTARRRSAVRETPWRRRPTEGAPKREDDRPTTPQFVEMTRIAALRAKPTWVTPLEDSLAGRLGVCRAPGRGAILQADLADLRAAGVDVLVCVGPAQFDTEQIGASGIAHLTVGIDSDPFLAAHALVDLSLLLEGERSAARTICVYSNDGSRRAGTALVASLVWGGTPLPEAIARVEAMGPHLASTPADVAILRRFSLLAGSQAPRR